MATVDGHTEVGQLDGLVGPATGQVLRLEHKRAEQATAQEDQQVLQTINGWPTWHS